MRVTYRPFRRSRSRKQHGWFRDADSFQPKRAGKRGKFGSVTATYEGVVYHSRAEALYAAQLDTLKKAHLPSERVLRWERQIKVPLVVNGLLVTTWYPDFHVWFADGHDEWHEVKGFPTPEYLIKERLFRALYPDRILKVIKV